MAHTYPILPYAGTSGWSGSDTSRQRAIHEDSTGVTGGNQERTLTELRKAGSYGLTWRELGELLGLHHGSASGVLSVLHKAGLIVRLREQRSRSAVYVTPDYVLGREVAAPRKRQLVLVLDLIDGADLDAIKREIEFQGLQRFQEDEGWIGGWAWRTR